MDDDHECQLWNEERWFEVKVMWMRSDRDQPDSNARDERKDGTRFLRRILTEETKTRSI